MKKIFRSTEGFTLVELMVVVAIIGVLTSVAIPNFRRYQAKAKTSEAKIQLAGIYSAMITLQSDYDHFAPCLTDAGFSTPTGNYYSVGFDADNTTARGLVVGEGGTCGASQFSFAAEKKVGGTKTVATDLDKSYAAGLAVGSLTANGVDNSGLDFIAGAIGYIDSDHLTNTDASTWGINSDKKLIETNKGY